MSEQPTITSTEVPSHEGPEPTFLGLNAPAFISLAMIVVIAIIVWKKVPAAIGKALDDKIAAEERSAIEQLRASTADAAAKAAAKLIAERHDAATDAQLVDRAIKEIAGR